MKTVKYNVIGLMSGTSCDGLDIANCIFWKDKRKWCYEIKRTKSINYNKSFKKKLLTCYKMNAYDLKKLDLEFGNYMLIHIKDFISENNIIPDLISSHGHTVFHNIKEKISHQIGNPFVLYNGLNVPIVYNLRELDVIAGGQGAPLVPFGDKHLFSQYDYCVNIGGILNISYTNNNTTYAFDVCPANTILNYFSRKLNLEFDDKGKIASTGRFIEKLYRDLNKISYYDSQGPKSLDIQYIEKNYFPLFKSYNIEDILNTYVEHIGHQLHKSLNKKRADVLLTGGGVFNEHLVRIINNKNHNINFTLPDKKLIIFKEGIIFGFLGLMRFLNRKNINKSVTGSSISSSSGIIINNKLY